MLTHGQAPRSCFMCPSMPVTHGLWTVSYLAAHVDWYAHNDYWDGDARYQGDDHRCAEQHAHLPHNLAGLRPWLLPPERAS